MIYEKDWFMREIKTAVEALARLVFGRDRVRYEVPDETRLTESDLLHRTLMALLQSGKVCEAEDYLFASFEPGNRSHLLVALDFYQRLSEMRDGELESANFSRREILEGLRDITAKFGLDL